MRLCVSALRPDCIIHLGDMFADGRVLSEENPGVPFYQVPGNCDMYRCAPEEPEIRIVQIGGVLFYLTHGHRHQVKSFLHLLLRDARTSGAAAVLYGHTHMENCYQEPDGLWVLNPGSCGYSGGTAGIVVVENRKIQSCRIIRHSDLEG